MRVQVKSGVKAVISLYDKTGNAVRPWAEAGYACFCYDVQHNRISTERVGKGSITYMPWDALGPGAASRVSVQGAAFVFAFPPCTHLAVSGARWFKGKGLRLLSQSIEMFAVAAEVCEASGAPYLIENPVSTISSYWRKPDHAFHPHEYAALCPDDNYTKKTCLWTGGGFSMPVAAPDLTLGAPDNRIHAAPPSAERADFRSATPMGFARAVYEANSHC